MRVERRCDHSPARMVKAGARRSRSTRRGDMIPARTTGRGRIPPGTTDAGMGRERAVAGKGVCP